MSTPRPNDLDAARQHAELSAGELWLRYFALGGMAAAIEIDAALHCALETPTHDYNQIVHAINERFAELGRGNRLPYRQDQDGSG